MKKILSIVIINILVVIILVGCSNKDQISDEEIQNIEYQEIMIYKLHEDVKDCIMTMDEYIENYFDEEYVDSELKDDFRDIQKTLRVNARDIEKIDMEIIHDYYRKVDNMNEYNQIRNKYNQANRFIRYSDYTTDILKDDKVTEDEAFNWICMREICNSEVPLSDEMKDNNGYDDIVKEYGYSLIDKQNEFDKKYEVEDIK